MWALVWLRLSAAPSRLRAHCRPLDLSLQSAALLGKSPPSLSLLLECWADADEASPSEGSGGQRWVSVTQGGDDGCFDAWPPSSYKENCRKFHQLFFKKQEYFTKASTIFIFFETTPFRVILQHFIFLFHATVDLLLVK